MICFSVTYVVHFTTAALRILFFNLKINTLLHKSFDPQETTSNVHFCGSLVWTVMDRHNLLHGKISEWSNNQAWCSFQKPD